MALVALPVQLLTLTVTPAAVSHETLPKWLVLLGMYAWLVIFWIQPHKEERFLFPIYPLLTLAGALTMDCVQRLAFRVFVKVKNTHYLDRTNWMSAVTLTLFALGALTRVLALYHHYNAPMTLWMNISHMEHNEELAFAVPKVDEVNICIGKEWHRFPGSFFLPNKRWKLRLLKSEFRGQLPQQFSRDTSLIRETFNDQNREESEGRYELEPDQCHFLVDLEIQGKETDLEPIYSNDSRWEILEKYDYLDAEKSNRLFRAFYVPILGAKYCSYGNYVLLRNKDPKIMIANEPKKKKKIRHL